MAHDEQDGVSGDRHRADQTGSDFPPAPSKSIWRAVQIARSRPARRSTACRVFLTKTATGQFCLKCRPWKSA